MYRSTYKIHNSLLPVPCFWAIVRLQTSYVPSDTTQRFIIVVSLMSGFQSSRLVSKSSAKRRQSPIKRPLLTKEPELQAEMLVLSSVMTTAPRLSTSHTWRFTPHDACNKQNLWNKIFESNEFHGRRLALFIVMHSVRSALSIMKGQGSLPVQWRPDTKHYTELNEWMNEWMNAEEIKNEKEE